MLENAQAQWVLAGGKDSGNDPSRVEEGSPKNARTQMPMEASGRGSADYF